MHLYNFAIDNWTFLCIMHFEPFERLWTFGWFWSDLFIERTHWMALSFCPNILNTTFFRSWNWKQRVWLKYRIFKPCKIFVIQVQNIMHWKCFSLKKKKCLKYFQHLLTRIMQDNYQFLKYLINFKGIFKIKKWAVIITSTDITFW